MANANLPQSSSLTRREILAAGASLLIPALAAEAQKTPQARLALPGPYRGRVVEVSHPGAVVDNKVQAPLVRQMMGRGMCALTGAQDETAAWKRFFAPGDVVGIKVCPVGRPLSISQPETLLEVIRGLGLAGIPAKDIVLFNRYEQEMLDCGFDKILPPGVGWGYAVKQFDGVQTDVEGYDQDVFVEMEKVVPGVDASVAVNRRSHLCNVVSKQVTKIVNVCALKDHASAGITMALKNMSHGFVNNVSRTHTDAANNWCDTFIPAVVGIRKIREKVVLHIGDGLIGTYDGGPGVWNPHFRIWAYGALFFATDPVALDRIGWSILDDKRAKESLPPLAQTGSKLKNPGHESFERRQPEHVLLAASAGLGEADLKKIEHRRIRLGS